MPKYQKSTGYKMKGFTYPGESPLKIASVSGAQLVDSVSKTYDKYVNYGKLVAEPIAKAVNSVTDPGGIAHSKAGTGKEGAEGEGKKIKQNGGSSSELEVNQDMMAGNLKLEEGDLSKNFQEGLSGKKKGGLGSASLMGG